MPGRCCFLRVSHSSRAVNQAESHYAPTTGECLALVWATKKFRQYLHGHKFRLRTDHAALQWLATARFENSKPERWAMRLHAGPCACKNSIMKSNIFPEIKMSWQIICLGTITTGSVTAVAGHLAFATEGRVLDIEDSGHDFMDPQSCCKNSLRELWSSGDTLNQSTSSHAQFVVLVKIMLTCCFATRAISRFTSSACTRLAQWCQR